MNPAPDAMPPDPAPNRQRRRRPALLVATATAPLVALLVWSTLGPSRSRHRVTATTATTRPATTSPTTTRAAAGRRTEAQVQADMAARGRQVAAAVGDPAALSDPGRRAAVAAVAVPLLKSLLTDLAELARLEPTLRPQLDLQALQDQCLLAALDDPAATGLLAELARNPNPAVAARGRYGQLLARWIQCGKDGSRQAAVAAGILAAIREHPADPFARQLAAGCARTAAEPTVAAKLQAAAAAQSRPTIGPASRPG